jgi:hypothetical protein
LEYLVLHNKPKAEVHPGHKVTGPEEEEEEEEVEKRKEKKEKKRNKRTKKLCTNLVLFTRFSVEIFVFRVATQCSSVASFCIGSPSPMDQSP